MCLCVCVFEREGERRRKIMCIRVCKREKDRKERERERERERLWETLTKVTNVQKSSEMVLNGMDDKGNRRLGRQVNRQSLLDDKFRRMSNGIRTTSLDASTG